MAKTTSGGGSTGGVFRRTRTGCLTCRKRKMKCDEAKPICGHCNKSQRTCQWQDGVVFRHQQNAAMNADGTSLTKFYKGSGTYTPEQRKSFVPIQGVQFVGGFGPYTEREVQASQTAPSPHQVNNHTLQTLAAAADQHPVYGTPNNHDLYPTYNQAAQPAHSAGISALLNPPTTTPTSMIDPNLDSSVNHNSNTATERVGNSDLPAATKERVETEEEPLNETDTKLAHALQGFSDGHGQINTSAEGQG